MRRLAVPLLVTSAMALAVALAACNDGVSRPVQRLGDATPTPQPTATPTAGPTPEGDDPDAPPPPAAIPAEMKIGNDFTCLLTTGGAVYCWGENGDGELGDGTFSDRSTPAKVFSGAKRLAVGEDHVCVLSTGGGVWCWGDGDEGQLGDGAGVDRASPVQASGLAANVKSLAAGRDYTCAVTSAGGLVCWGDNGEGNLGDGTDHDRLVPTPVLGLSSGFSAVFAGEDHTCAVGPRIVCWGDGGDGELGDGHTDDSDVPVEVAPLP